MSSQGRHDAVKKEYRILCVSVILFSMTKHQLKKKKESVFLRIKKGNAACLKVLIRTKRPSVALTLIPELLLYLSKLNITRERRSQMPFPLLK